MASDLGLSDDIGDLSGTRTRSRGNPSESDGGGLWPRIRLAVAILFAASTVLYSAIWMYYVRISPQASLGFDFQEHISQKYVEITRVYPGGAAERAGLHAGDRLISVYGRPFYSREPLYTAFVGGHAGDSVPLTVLRSGSGSPQPVTVVLDPAPPDTRKRSPGEIVMSSLLSSFPVLFVLVGFPVLFLRIQDRSAWLLCLCFAGLIASAPMAMMSGIIPPALRGFALAYLVAFFPIVPAAFYYLFATFPAQSRIDKRIPWLKKVLLGAAVLISAPLACLVLMTGSLDPAWFVLTRIPSIVLTGVGNLYMFGGFALGLLSLIGNSVQAPTVQARIKTRVMVWGTVLGMAPWIVMRLISMHRHIDFYQLPYWYWAPAVLAIFLMPVSIAYAVVKHRVLEVPVLLRRSARYLLVQRGFLILIMVLGVGATLALAHSFSQQYPANSGAAIPIGAMFGIALVGGGAWVQQRVSQRVDRAFFRNSYDTKQILEELVEKTREVRTRTQLSNLLESHLRQALHPTFLLVYLLLRDDSPPEGDAQEVSLDSPFLNHVFERGQPYEISPQSTSLGLERLRAECLVPISGRDGQRLGLLVLGPRKSEEPYSREDKRLLAIIASQASSTLENIQMGEEIAERMEVERRAAHEIDLARQVQRKLFPQNPPRVATLDFAGECVQARVVGGDYYDFLELAPGLIGFALADISGKGFPAALLMANLQANLRGQYGVAREDLPRLLQSVNRLFYANSEPSHYATMFFGCYEAQSRRLRYVNCGHNPPLLLRRDNTVERLESTATVMGLFPEWECEVAEVQLYSGDLFAIYTDGVTEAAAPDGEEFGEERLIALLRENRAASAASLLGTLIAGVQKFSPGEQGDDITAVIAKVL